MKIFITGATGYIGGVLRDRLLEEGHVIHAIYRPTSEKEIDFSEPGITYFKGDLLNRDSLRRAMDGCEQVYHVAAYARVWSRDKSLFYKVNVEGTRNVLALAHELGVHKVVVTSTGATLQKKGRSNPADETNRKKNFRTAYAKTKYLAEEQTLEYNHKGLKTVIVHPPRVYGPGLLSESNAVTKIIKWYLEGKWRFIPGDGSYIGNYAFVEDVVAGHRKAMDRGRPGERYILGGANLSFNELFRLIAEVTGLKRTLWPVPLSLIRPFARFEQWKADKMNIAPLITPQWVDNYTNDSALTSGKAIKELHYEITPPETALSGTVDWLKNHH